jgi:acyl CoA:acetate/3-ketoacid CoA transferase beta subunit
MMGATQLDRFGRQNISCIGPHDRPKAQLIGARGAPGNTINHTTSYFIPQHTKRVFVDKVDFVCGVGVDHAKELRCVISNLGVFDFEGGVMRVRSLHPGVTLAQVQAATGFEIGGSEDLTRAPTDEELRLIAALDPDGKLRAEL